MNDKNVVRVGDKLRFYQPDPESGILHIILNPLYLGTCGSNILICWFRAWNNVLILRQL